MEGLRSPSGGTIRVLGLDPQAQGPALRESIGVQLQESNLSDRLKVWEAMDLFSAFYRRTTDWRALIEQVGLSEKRNSTVEKLSGGQKQRLYIALALVNDPALVFMDELTTGLDPQARRAMWDLVRAIRGRGKTVVLTTHFMEEAERLCDRLAIMDGGRIIALDTPQNLIRSLGRSSRIVFEVDGDFDPAWMSNSVPGAHVEYQDGTAVVSGEADGLIGAVVRALESRGIRFRNFHTETPTLEDVFLSLTGRAIRD
jgi:ABC-2 type transport system ATP-binding protein